MFKRLKDWWRWQREADAYGQMMETYEGERHGYTDTDPWQLIWFWLGESTPSLECKFMHGGHDLVDEGYAGPESGSIDLVCQRCGWSYHHQLY